MPYLVRTPNLEERVVGRASAIDMARSVSRSSRHPVLVEREDSAVKMRYRRGTLQEYKVDTRRVVRS